VTLRSALYRAARLLGDWRAIRKGPRAIVRRGVRKVLLRAAGRTVNRWTR
jgi:hypothetical protein